MGKVIKKVLMGFAGLIVLLILITYGISRDFSATVTEEVPCSQEDIFNLLQQSGTWPSWSYWSQKMDSAAVIELYGPESGPGSGYQWNGPVMGQGKIQIQRVVPQDSIIFQLILQDSTFSMEGRISLEPTGAGTRIKWQQSGSVKRDPIEKYLKLIAQKHLERHLKQSITGLKRECE